MVMRRVERVSVDVSAVDDPESDRFPRTKQSFKEECDINNIMRSYERTGLVDHVNAVGGHYGDYTNLPQDYQSALNQVLAAQRMFMTIPAEVRERFGNDPGKFLRFVEDPANAGELVKLGLAKARPEVAPGGNGRPELPPGGGAEPGGTPEA